MDGFLVPEEGERGEGLHAVGLCVLLVGDLDEVDTEPVRVVVDVLQLLQHLVAVLAALLVCGARGRTEGRE